MKKYISLLISCIFLTGCSNVVGYLMGRREQDGLKFHVGPGPTTIYEFADEILDDEIIYIPSSLRNYWSGEPVPILIKDDMWLGGTLSSDALRIFYLTGNQTSFYSTHMNALPNLEMAVFNTLYPTYLPEFHPSTTLEDVVQYGFFFMFSHESFDNVVQYYHDLWNSKYRPEPWGIPAGLLSSRISYYYNYDNSPNEGLYRIGMEYDIGEDLTPPENPIRIKNQNLFGTEYYTFQGWSTTRTVFRPYDFESSDDAIDVQLYAHWE